MLLLLSTSRRDKRRIYRLSWELMDCRVLFQARSKNVDKNMLSMEIVNISCYSVLLVWWFEESCFSFVVCEFVYPLHCLFDSWISDWFLHFWEAFLLLLLALIDLNLDVDGGLHAIAHWGVDDCSKDLAVGGLIRWESLGDVESALSD